MRRILLVSPALLMASVMLYGCNWWHSRPTVAENRPVSAVVAENQRAPDIDGEDTTGQRLHLADYRGKVVVLQFWANW
jgi:hypothetical protein